MADPIDPPASTGSESDSSAGPSTTPSAATAVRPAAVVSAATGSCSITRMCRPWGKLGVARTSRTTRYGRDRREQRAGANVQRAHVPRRPGQGRFDRPASGPCTPLICTRSTDTSGESRSHSQPPRSAGSAIRAVNSPRRRRRRRMSCDQHLRARLRAFENGAVGSNGRPIAARPARERSIAHVFDLRARTPTTRESEHPRASEPPARAPRRSARARGGGPRPSRRSPPRWWRRRCSR